MSISYCCTVVLLFAHWKQSSTCSILFVPSAPSSGDLVSPPRQSNVPVPDQQITHLPCNSCEKISSTQTAHQMHSPPTRQTLPTCIFAKTDMLIFVIETNFQTNIRIWKTFLSAPFLLPVYRISWTSGQLSWGGGGGGGTFTRFQLHTQNGPNYNCELPVMPIAETVNHPL